jgi:deoxyribodipyrimidine photo-lyase
MVIVWFRQDLRLEDNPAWNRAVESGRGVVPVYIHAMEEAGKWRLGAASRWWLHHALEDLEKQLSRHNLRLICRRGESEAEIFTLLKETGANAVYWNRCYEPHRMRIDGRIKSRLKETGHEVWSGNASVLREPWEVSTQTGNPYKVFTPYSRACAKTVDPEPVTTRARPVVPEAWPRSDSLDSLSLLPEIPWDKGFHEFWNPIRSGGLDRLGEFLDSRVKDYDGGRDFPWTDGTSKLSPYLHFGQIGPREVAALIRKEPASSGLTTFYRELVWREFAYHVLYHFPDTPEKPLQPKFGRFPWKETPGHLEAWQRGRTGYPIVDAGMRQLWKVGWMHNRVRMIVGSLLVKHLLHTWEHGAEWFWDTLVDADLASNTLGWQWAGGCGADAAPYFRIFNPITQGEKFDAEGAYIREYVPELAMVSNQYIHTPWEMPEAEQVRSGCRIGDDYPAPVIDHKAGREQALVALGALKELNA